MFEKERVTLGTVADLVDDVKAVREVVTLFPRNWPLRAAAWRLTPGEAQVRALFTVATNSVLSSPNGPRLAAAL